MTVKELITELLKHNTYAEVMLEVGNEKISVTSVSSEWVKNERANCMDKCVILRN